MRFLFGFVCFTSWTGQVLPCICVMGLACSASAVVGGLAPHLRPGLAPPLRQALACSAFAAVGGLAPPFRQAMACAAFAAGAVPGPPLSRREKGPCLRREKGSCPWGVEGNLPPAGEAHSSISVQVSRQDSSPSQRMRVACARVRRPKLGLSITAVQLPVCRMFRAGQPSQRDSCFMKVL